jgi:hypothetical protein
MTSSDAYRIPDVTMPDVGAPTPVTPVGTALAMLAGARIVGVTDDAYVVYVDAVGSTYVVPFGGGSAPVRIVVAGGPDAGSVDGSVLSFTDVVVSHDIVAVWASTLSALAPTALYVWSSKMGSARAVSATSVPGLFEAAPDSSFFTFFADASADRSNATLYAGASSGGPPTVLAPATVLAERATCPERQLFAGPYVVLASCTATGSFGMSAPSVVSFDGMNAWQKAVLVESAADQIALDPTATNVLAVTSGGSLVYVPVGGGPATTVDTAVSTTSTSTGTLFVAPNPLRAIYQTGSNALKVASLPSGTAAALPTGSVGTIFGLSPDGAYVSYATSTTDLMSGYPTVLNAISTLAGSTVVALEHGNPGTVFSDLFDPDTFDGSTLAIGTDYPFTADGAYALFTTVPMGSADDTPPGSLQATNLASGKGVTLSETSVFTAVPLTGASVAWNDAYNAAGNAIGTGIGDLHVGDFSTGTSTLVLHGADAAFAVAPDHSRLAYSLNYGTSEDGIYVVAIP